MVRILVEISQPVLHINLRIVLELAGNVLVETSPVLPVQEKHPDSYEICQVLIIVGAVNLPIALQALISLSDNLLNEMARIL